MPMIMLTPCQHSIIRYTTLDSISTSFYYHHPIHTNIFPNIDSTYSMVPHFLIDYLSISPTKTDECKYLHPSDHGFSLPHWLILTVSCSTGVLMSRKAYSIVHTQFTRLGTIFVLSHMIDQPLSHNFEHWETEHTHLRRSHSGMTRVIFRVVYWWFQSTKELPKAPHIAPSPFSSISHLSAWPSRPHPISRTPLPTTPPIGFPDLNCPWGSRSAGKCQGK